MAREHYSSLQQVFDDAFRGLRAQGFRRSTKEGADSGCMYRAPGGERCAIGHCIPDEVYVIGMEFRTLNSLLTHYPSVRILFSGEILREDLRELQRVHDRNEPDMEGRLRHYARSRGLTVPED